MRFPLAYVFGAVVGVAVLAGCPGDDDDDGGSCKEYTPPAGFDPQTPTSSFSRDVMPIFAQSCAFTSCHGNANGESRGVILGGGDAKKVRQGLVDVPASEHPSMPFVKPGNPRESFLMHKIDGTQCLFASQCTDGKCGVSMPLSEPLLAVETRDKVRRWIAQGAKDD